MSRKPISALEDFHMPLPKTIQALLRHGKDDPSSRRPYLRPFGTDFIAAPRAIGDAVDGTACGPDDGLGSAWASVSGILDVGSSR